MLSRNSLSELSIFRNLQLPSIRVFSVFSNYIKTESNSETDFKSFVEMLATAMPNLIALSIEGNPLTDT
jgi:hypothetical protein